MLPGFPAVEGIPSVKKEQAPFPQLYLKWYNALVIDKEKPLVWLGSSKKDLMALPMGLRKFFGHCLHFAQQGVRLPNRGSATNPPRSSRDLVVPES